MNDRNRPVRIFFLAALGLFLLNQSGAQPDASAPSLPVRAARLTFVAGGVRVQRSDNTGDDTAVLNMPLGEGTRILTGDYGQAEVEFEDGSVARLTPRSALSINVLALDSASIAHTEAVLLGGLVYFELRKSPGYTWLLDAGGTRITPLENLTLRLKLDDPPPVFAVLAGSGHIERPDAFEADLHAGETLRADFKDNTRYFLTPQLAQETWDSWNESRDRAAVDASDKRTAARNDYAADQGYGWSDLDANGNWYNVPGTGPNSPPVWQPSNADEGFDPYGYGAWVWGNGAYLWASGYSWGWTPFRCGHWQYFNGFGWGWIPDSGCGRWSFAGGGYLGEFGQSGVFVRGPYPPRRNPVIRPQPRPGQPHPVVPVRGPNGPRPWTPHGGPVKIAGALAQPLPTLGSGASSSGSSVGRALALDFPVDRKTHQPILGAVPSLPSSPPVYVNVGSGTRRAHPEDTPGAAPSPGTSGRRNPSPVQGTAFDSIPASRQLPGVALPAAPRPAPGGDTRYAPVAPVHTPSVSPPPTRPAPPLAPPAPRPAPAASPPAAAPKPKG